VVTADYTAPTGQQSHGTAKCGAGTVVWGGGVYITGSSLALRVNSSYPLSTTGWQAYVVNDSGADTSFSVSAVCAKKPTGYKVMKKTVPSFAFAQATAVSSCGSLKAVGGGGSTPSRSLDVAINSTYPRFSPPGWRTDLSNDTDLDTTVTSYAICVSTAVPGDYTWGAIPTDNPPHTQTAESIDCGSFDKVPISGGVESSSKSPSVTLATSAPVGTKWKIWQNNPTDDDATVKRFAICA
jgi:hypothetical protein